MNIMQANPKIGSMDAVLDKLYGKVGSPEREEFRKEAYSYCVGQIISDARKQEKMTQSELAEKVGTNKTYISRIEKGIIEPGVGLFFRIIDAVIGHHKHRTELIFFRADIVSHIAVPDLPMQNLPAFIGIEF